MVESTLTEEFIGRVQEIAFLLQWLKDENAAPIIYIHDALEESERKGGIGKTWLLRRLYELVQEQNNVIVVPVDFFNVTDRSGVVIAERVIQAIRKKYPRWQAENTTRLLKHYHEAGQGQKAEAIMLRGRLAEALSDDLRFLQQQMIESGTYILLLFDTYELIERNPVTAVLRPSQTFPDNYQSKRVRAIVAGRNAIDWKHQNWVDREKECLVRPLPPFTQQETIAYLHNRVVSYEIEHFPAGALEAFYQKTDGRPILVGLVSDVLNKRIKDANDLAKSNRMGFEGILVEQINRFDDPSKWTIFSMAHIYHRFDAHFLHRLMEWPGLKDYLPEIQYSELVSELPTLSFVRSTGDGQVFVLHDEMRRLVNKYCWELQDSDGRIRRELSLLATGYYSELIAQEEDEEKRQSYIVEKLFHDLFLDVEVGFHSFEQQLDYALRFSLRTFARALFQELQKFEQKFSDEQRQTMKLAEARVLREEENPGAALSILSSFDPSHEWTERHRSDLLFEKGSCYEQLSQYFDAITCFEDCLKIEQRSRDKTRQELLLNHLGYIHRVQGWHDRAMGYYQEALKVQRNLDNAGEYANLLNNMGNVLRLQGKLEDALRYCKQALRIRRDLVRQKKISEYYVGLSLSTLGHIYHTMGEHDEEERVYQEAFDIYSMVGDKSAIAGAYICLGRVWVEKRDLEKAGEDFQRAADIAIGVSWQAEIESYNQLGRIELLQEQWEKAIEFFEKAVALARQVGQNFNLAENLLYLVEALDHCDQKNRSPYEYIREAKRLARKHNYEYLLARIAEIQGDSYLRRNEYIQAFKQYRVACYHMALRGGLEYNQILRKLNDHLLELPDGFLPGVIDVLLSYWNEKGLDEVYPQVPEMCREVGRHMLL
jgi:tetratricopeptide (TPR) repeat protein